jgi:hypothetical protein
MSRPERLVPNNVSANVTQALNRAMLLPLGLPFKHLDLLTLVIENDCSG